MRRVAVVTGSASGIGLATMRLGAERGYTVVGLDIAPERPDAAVARETSGAALDADVTDQSDVEHAVARAAALGHLCVAVSCAGVLEERPLGEITDELFARTLLVHLGGFFHVVRAAGARMTVHGAGSIVGVLSELVTVGAPGHAHYVIAKASMAGLARAAARELGSDGIRVNAVAPGPVDTPLLGPGGRDPDYVRTLALRRLGGPTEIARAILDVAEWEWTTGAVVHVNGGAVIRG